MKRPRRQFLHLAAGIAALGRTVAESGYEGYDLNVWVGVLAPVKPPKDKTSQLAGWFTAAMKALEVEQKLMTLGYYPVGLCGADALTSRSNLKSTVASSETQTSRSSDPVERARPCLVRVNPVNLEHVFGDIKPIVVICMSRAS